MITQNWTIEQKEHFTAVWQALVLENGGKPLPKLPLEARNIAIELGLMPAPSATVECTWDGRKYRGTVYLVEEAECD